MGVTHCIGFSFYLSWHLKPSQQPSSLSSLLFLHQTCSKIEKQKSGLRGRGFNSHRRLFLIFFFTTSLFPFFSNTTRFNDPPSLKTKSIAYMASNCYGGGALGRTEYLKELMEYIQIDSYGQFLCFFQHSRNKEDLGSNPTKLFFQLSQIGKLSQREKAGFTTFCW